jgi:glutamate-1-semialdehyde 2,1-aminomutase
MAAGLAALKELTPEAYDRLNALGDLFKREVNEKVFDDLGIAAQAYGCGSLLIIHYTHRELKNYREARKAGEQAAILPMLAHLCHLNNGIWIAERGEFALSTPMTEEDIGRAVQAFRKTYLELRPFIQEHLPHLVKD